MKRFDLFVKLVERILKINSEICLDEHGYLDKGVLAGAVKEKNLILISNELLDKMDNNPLEVYLILAHELRHVWQFVNQTCCFDDYYNSKELSSKYENQECEIDANAFAYLVVRLITGKTPRRNTWAIHSYDSVILRVRELEFKFELRCKNREVKRLVSILKRYN